MDCGIKCNNVTVSFRTYQSREPREKMNQKNTYYVMINIANDKHWIRITIRIACVQRVTGTPWLCRKHVRKLLGHTAFTYSIPIINIISARNRQHDTLKAVENDESEEEKCHKEQTVNESIWKWQKKKKKQIFPHTHTCSLNSCYEAHAIHSYDTQTNGKARFNYVPGEWYFVHRLWNVRQRLR